MSGPGGIAERLARIGYRLGPLVPLLPRRWRSRVVQSLSSDLLIQAIGNLESRDELFWLRREAWGLAHRVLALEGIDRFREHTWALGLETGITDAAFMAVVSDHYRRGHPSIRGPLDRLLQERWRECFDPYVWRLRETRVIERRRRDLERGWPPDGPVATGTLRALRETLCRAPSLIPPVGLIVARPGFLATRTYRDVLSELRALGAMVVWLELGDRDDSGGEGTIRSREHPWGLEVHAPLAPPAELAEQWTKTYREITDEVLAGIRCLPGRWRELSTQVARELPIAAWRWVAASAAAEILLDTLALHFVHVQADKDPVARAFILAARARSVPTSYYYRSLELGAPSFWPVTDRVLVANAARGRRLRELGLAGEHIVPVGSLEIDQLLQVKGVGSPRTSTQRDPSILVLTKWPVSLFFGDAERLGRLLREMARIAPGWHWTVKPHPKDATDYGSVSAEFGGQVEIRRDGYPKLVSEATLVVSAMGNSVFHALATGKPLIVFNPDKRINLGHDRLFARPDLPAQVRLAESWDALRAALLEFVSGRIPLTPYETAPSMVEDLFHALDGGSASRIAATLVGAATTVLE